MSITQLDNLVKIGQLKTEPPAPAEILGFISTGQAKLKDSELISLSLESRFDLCYNAAHALALAVLRWHGYRSENRFTVFQCLVHTTNLTPVQIRILVDAHEKRNRAEYEGVTDINLNLITSLIRSTQELLKVAEGLAPY